MTNFPPETSAPELSPIKRALLEIRELRAQLDEMDQAQNEPVAIIGLGLRFPADVTDADSFWRLLSDGVDAITEIPPTRWRLEDFYDADVSQSGKMITRHGSFLKDVDRFDPAFFGISPREALSMDPQQRLLLEVTWEALENAGQSPEKLFGTQTGVFVGISNSDYGRMVLSDLEKIDTYASTGGTLSVAAGRISYLLGLHGPAVSVDTACSSSLVAVHLACHSLRRKESNLALIGGVNLILSPEANINFSKAGMMALDGRCKTFDALADGYVRGEGCAMIVLKRLSDAEADGDHILAVVRGSAINQDGRSGGLTAPSGPAQEAVIRAALKSAGIEPNQVGYVEAHGTGTSLGDPIEVRALGTVYGEGRDATRPLLIGSVKTNIGHLEAAAGIAGLLKVVLALRHSEIPPHLHFKTPNPYIPWADISVSVPTRPSPWPSPDGRRIAGISSFGFSGTNAHVIVEGVEEQEINEKIDDARPLHLLTLSAKSALALHELAGKYEQFLAQSSVRPVTDITYTANTGRSHYTHRLAVSATDVNQIRARLTAFSAGQKTNGVWKGENSGDAPQVVFLFTGHGSHYVNMSRQLYETEPIFRAAMDRCGEFLKPHLPQPLLSVLYPQSTVENQPPQIDDMAYGQPAMFAIEYALALLWRSWGIEPTAVAGHSLGEYVAAAVAGVISLEDSLTLIAERGRLMQNLEDGEMVTVFAEEARVAPLIVPYTADVSIAAVNSPETVVISGRRAAVLEVVQKLKAEKIRTRPLNVSRAAHSPLVESMIPAIARTSAGMRFSPPQIEFFSSVLGRAVNQELTQPEYWQRHLRQTVRFADVAAALYAAGYRTFLEIGPNPTLISLGQRSVPDAESCLWLPSLRQGWADWEQIAESLAQLYVHGARIDWDAFHQNGPGRKIPLPTTPWDRKSYWWKVESKATLTSTPTWETAIAAAGRQADQAPLDLEISAFPSRWQALNQLASAYMLNALDNLGAFDGRPLTPESLLTNCGIQPTYRTLMSRWLKFLATEGMLENPHSRAVEPLLSSVQKALVTTPFVSEYVQECGERLAAVLTGQESPLELMFPGGSMQRAEDLYQNWAHARYFNHIVGAATQAVAYANPGKTLQILEVGAGTGSTTASVLPVLSARRVAYHFTDVSDLFLDRARQKFAAFPFVQYGLLDVEKDGLAQGYGRGQFDVIIAANVIHATRSLSDTVQNVRRLLAPHGVLILFEATTHQPWYDITTGLIEGWQSFGDDLRADSPLLTADQWKTILQAEGFTAVNVFPEKSSPAEILGESVILARPPAEEAVSVEILETEGMSLLQEIAATQETASADALLEQLRVALPEERKEILLDMVRNHIMAVLRLDESSAPARRARLMDLGVDSLMAVELRGRLSTGLKLERKLPATLIFDYPTIEAITDYLLNEVLIFESPSTPGADIESLSDDEVEAMLLEKLKKLK